MSKPVSYEEFCNRYELDKDAPESKEDYAEYIDKLAFLSGMMEQPRRDSEA